MDRVFGTVSPQDFARLSGCELLLASMEGRAASAAIAEGMNFRLVEVGDGIAVFEGEPGPQHLNPLGSVHGGWALTLIDSACGCAVHTTLPAGVGYSTVETKVNFTRAISADGGTMRTVGTVVARGRTIMTAEARMTDGQGRLVAHGTSTLIVLQPRNT